MGVCLAAIYFDQGVDAVRLFVQQHLLKDPLFTSEGTRPLHACGVRSLGSVAMEVGVVLIVMSAVCPVVGWHLAAKAQKDSMPTGIEPKVFLALQWKMGLTLNNQVLAVQVLRVLLAAPSEQRRWL